MTAIRNLQASLSQQALSLGLAALVTAGVLAALLGEAGGDQAAQLAQQMQPVPQAIATVLVTPMA
jgi:hypothetical protein